jgi:hypothetical protein
LAAYALEVPEVRREGQAGVGELLGKVGRKEEELVRV